MAIIKDRIDHDLIIGEPTSLLGLIHGKVTVLPGVNLQVHGRIVGTLIVEAGSEVFMHGVIQGDVINRGGQLHVFGMVSGEVITESGTTVIDSRARTAGRR